MLVGIGGPEGASVAAVWEHSRRWWRDHGLTGIADALGTPPGVTDLPPDDGIGFAFPPASVQRAHLPALLALATYDAPAAVATDLLDGALDRPGHPYLLTLPADRLPEWTRGHTAPALRAELAARGYSGLTVPEYLVLQRQSFDTHGDHRFDSYTGDAPGWTWLPASTHGPLVGMAYYEPRAGHVQIAACKTGSKNPRKGAHIARVLPR